MSLTLGYSFWNSHALCGRFGKCLLQREYDFQINQLLKQFTFKSAYHLCNTLIASSTDGVFISPGIVEGGNPIKTHTPPLALEQFSKIYWGCWISNGVAHLYTNYFTIQCMCCTKMNCCQFSWRISSVLVSHLWPPRPQRCYLFWYGSRARRLDRVRWPPGWEEDSANLKIEEITSKLYKMIHVPLIRHVHIHVTFICYDVNLVQNIFKELQHTQNFVFRYVCFPFSVCVIDDNVNTPTCTLILMLAMPW